MKSWQLTECSDFSNSVSLKAAAVEPGPLLDPILVNVGGGAC